MLVAVFLLMFFLLISWFSNYICMGSILTVPRMQFAALYPVRVIPFKKMTVHATQFLCTTSRSDSVLVKLVLFKNV